MFFDLTSHACPALRTGGLETAQGTGFPRSWILAPAVDAAAPAYQRDCMNNRTGIWSGLENPPAIMRRRLHLFYFSGTGNAQRVAHWLAVIWREEGVDVTAANMVATVPETLLP